MDWHCLNCKSFNALKSSLCPNCYEKEMILKGIPSNNDVDISTITNMLDDLKVRNEQDNFNFTLTQDVNSLILFSTQKFNELQSALKFMDEKSFYIVETLFLNNKLEHIENVLLQKIDRLKSHTLTTYGINTHLEETLQIFRHELNNISQEFIKVIEKEYELLKSYILEHKRIIETDYLQILTRWTKSEILVLGANYSNNDVKFWTRIDINYIGLGIDISNDNVKTRFQNNWNSPNYWDTSFPSKVFNVIYIDRFSLYKICKDGQLNNFLQFINHYRHKETKLLITKNEMDKIEMDKIEIVNNPIFNDALKYFQENKWVYTMDVNFTQLFTNTNWITSLDHKDIESREKWIFFEFM